MLATTWPATACSPPSLCFVGRGDAAMIERCRSVVRAAAAAWNDARTVQRSSFAARDMLVPDSPNDPQNRRVQIVFPP